MSVFALYLSFQDWLSITREIRYPNVDAERIKCTSQPAPLLEYKINASPLEELMKSNKFNEKKKNDDAAGRF